MNKSRLEAFSDGVFSIAITLLVFNITIPDCDYAHLSENLMKMLPKILSYVMTFTLIGLYWIGHHFYFDRIKMVDGNFVWMNMILLLFICFMPFPTGLLGKFPYGAIPLTLYGLNLIATNIHSFLMLKYLYKHRHLTNDHFKEEFYQTQLPLFFWINVTYITAIVLAFYYPVVSYILYLVTLGVAVKVYVKRMNLAVREKENHSAE
jgi:uncharacterized membrane protein